MTAIQKAREALESVKQLTVGDRCPNWNTIAAVTQSRFAIANICDAALAALDAETEGWRTMDSAPKDGTHIIGLLYREACEDMDGRKHRAFTEVREIFYKPYFIFGMNLPWHAGDPMDSHDGVDADSHMGEAVPIGWLPRSALPFLKARS